MPSESRGDERVPSWKLVALTATLLLFFVGPLILISWLWGGPGFCPAIPMMEIMTNINDKMASPNPDGGAPPAVRTEFDLADPQFLVARPRGGGTLGNKRPRRIGRE